MTEFVDACVMTPEAPPSRPPALPEGCGGAVFFGAAAADCSRQCASCHPAQLWRHAERLARVPAQNEAQSAARAPVVDLVLEGPAREDWFARPDAWWPLCYPLGRTGRLLRLPVPPGSAIVVKVKHLARRFPEVRFWVDPFLHGPLPGWQGQVRLAEEDNVWLTTLGLDPVAGERWSAGAAKEALYFVTGEVGAGKLLYASGTRWKDWVAGRERPMREWLAAEGGLDARELELVLAGNARGLFA